MLGYATFKICGLNLVRIPDLMLRRKIAVFGVNITNKELIFSVKSSQYNESVALFEEMCYNYSLIGFKGFSAMLKVIQSNIIIAIAALFICITVLYANSLCWRISIDTGTLAADKEVRQILSDRGVKGFCNKSLIRYDELENLLTNSIEGAEYTFIAFRGNTLSVRITPRATVKPGVDYSLPNDIISTIDGVVTRIVTLRGTARVKIGDKVVKGQTLIEGIVVYSDQTVSEVCAIGEVFLEISRTGEAYYAPIKSIYTATGRVTRITEFTVFRAKVESVRGIPYEYYDASVTEYVLAPLPITLRNILVKEYRVALVSRTFAEQLEELKHEAYGNALQFADFEIIRTDYTVTEGQRVVAVLFGEVSGGIYKTLTG